MWIDFYMYRPCPILMPSGYYEDKITLMLCNERYRFVLHSLYYQNETNNFLLKSIHPYLIINKDRYTFLFHFIVFVAQHLVWKSLIVLHAVFQWVNNMESDEAFGGLHKRFCQKEVKIKYQLDEVVLSLP